MAELPWQVWFDGCTSRHNPDATALAGHLRAVASSGKPCPPDLLIALAELLDPPSGYLGTTMRLIRPKGGKGVDWRQQYEMANDVRQRVLEGVKPIAVVFEVAQQYGISERSAWRAYNTVKAAMGEEQAPTDIEWLD